MIIDKQKWAILVCNQCNKGVISDESCIIITRYPYAALHSCTASGDDDVSKWEDITDRVKILPDRIEILDSEIEK